jgi:hypothetical protein
VRERDDEWLMDDRGEGDDQQRDYAEEAYWRNYCQACGASPCGWDGEPDGFHTDDPVPGEYRPGA